MIKFFRKNKNSKVGTRKVVIPDDIEDVKKLWLDYLVWGNDKMQLFYGVHPHNPVQSVENDIQQIDKLKARENSENPLLKTFT
jgi:hypothetical protein